jgi:4-hydroxy-3-methylbut-2-enyl diphosphate reductase
VQLWETGLHCFCADPARALRVHGRGRIAYDVTMATHDQSASGNDASLDVFHSSLVDRLRAADPPNVWPLPGGELRLPRVFGFCRGVKRALAMADRAVREYDGPGRIVLLGEIIHNPWVNDYFRSRGVTILPHESIFGVEAHVRADDLAIIPAFGVPLEVERRLEQIGCRSVDCSCGDVIRLWRWSQRAVEEGFGVLIFGRATHDETVVTKSRLAAAGGKYLVVETLEQARQLAEEPTDERFRELFGPEQTNAEDLDPFGHLALVSQTTMLYSATVAVQQIVREAFTRRFGQAQTGQRLRMQPAVCKATQSRQDAAVELCSSGCDAVIVVGGFGSSNTRHLHALASQYAPAWLIEDASAIASERELTAFDPESQTATTARDWLPSGRPVTLGVLAGASSPEVVIGDVLRKLADFLG